MLVWLLVLLKHHHHCSKRFTDRPVLLLLQLLSKSVVTLSSSKCVHWRKSKSKLSVVKSGVKNGGHHQCTLDLCTQHTVGLECTVSTRCVLSIGQRFEETAAAAAAKEATRKISALLPSHYDTHSLTHS